MHTWYDISVSTPFCALAAGSNHKAILQIQNCFLNKNETDLRDSIFEKIVSNSIQFENVERGK